MAHTHGGTELGHDHHGGGRGLAWELLDSIMLGCFVVVAGLLAELLYRRWRASRSGVRYDLTPKGLAVTKPHTGPLIDEEALRAAVARGDLGTD